MRRVAGAVLIAISLVSAAPADAVTGDDRDAVGQITDGAPEAVVVVGQSGTVGSWEGTPRGGARWTCGYYAFDVDTSDSDGGLAAVRYDDGPVDPEAQKPYVLICRDEAGNQVRSLLQVFDPADPLAGIATTERALDEARRRLDLPLPEPAINPPGTQLAGVPTWLWVAGPWAQRSATAAVGAVAATVTAGPDHVVWNLGDGTTVTCDAGTPYDTARAPADQSSDCTHVFTRSSAALPDGTYAVTVTISYAVTWSATTGAGGSLGALTRTATLPVRVSEAQALIR